MDCAGPAPRLETIALLLYNQPEIDNSDTG